jgi:hypothetical protein
MAISFALPCITGIWLCNSPICTVYKSEAFYNSNQVLLGICQRAVFTFGILTSSVHLNRCGYAEDNVVKNTKWIHNPQIKQCHFVLITNGTSKQLS